MILESSMMPGFLLFVSVCCIVFAFCFLELLFCLSLAFQKRTTISYNTVVYKGVHFYCIPKKGQEEGKN